jgi:hypothetical protein
LKGIAVFCGADNGNLGCPLRFMMTDAAAVAAVAAAESAACAVAGVFDVIDDGDVLFWVGEGGGRLNVSTRAL